jgi:hypothetical protein
VHDLQLAGLGEMAGVIADADRQRWSILMNRLLTQLTA